MSEPRLPEKEEQPPQRYEFVLEPASSAQAAIRRLLVRTGWIAAASLP